MNQPLWSPSLDYDTGIIMVPVLMELLLDELMHIHR